MRMISALSAAALLILTTVATLATGSAQVPGFLGRWNLTGTGEDANRIYWLEVTDKGGALSGMFLNRGGSPVPLASVAVQNNELVFQLAAGSNKQPGAEFRARLEGDKLVGSTKASDRVVNFVGVRPPKWPASDANAKHTYGKPVELFDGKSMNGFDTQPSNYPVTWTVEEGVARQRPADPQPDLESRSS